MVIVYFVHYLGLSSKELSTLYKQEKAQVTKKGKECLEEWFHQNLHKLEEIKSAVVWNSMSALSHSKMMAKTVTDMSEKGGLGWASDGKCLHLLELKSYHQNLG
ncbi:hypothetical protein BS47DRAFT_1365752 [Hydnum rufescens UP504]|uniref:Uncharacterized protein n=1 Tax=Hydnum rufescens UP504 TaxID=1448309 RepID=A0A9P6ANV4_9AGAM|nr:hypothetical protein BS47DRAFT_1365752 [Hydnum rufescens UP504]